MPGARILEHEEEKAGEAAGSGAAAAEAAADTAPHGEGAEDTSGYTPNELVKSMLDRAGGTALDRSVPLDRTVLAQGIATKRNAAGTQRTSRKGT
eukprot:COSAG05_NODE_11219_length_524_cov_1.216471_1_plen_94_part_10